MTFSKLQNSQKNFLSTSPGNQYDSRLSSIQSASLENSPTIEATARKIQELKSNPSLQNFHEERSQLESFGVKTTRENLWLLKKIKHSNIDFFENLQTNLISKAIQIAKKTNNQFSTTENDLVQILEKKELLYSYSTITSDFLCNGALRFFLCLPHILEFETISPSFTLPKISLEPLDLQQENPKLQLLTHIDKIEKQTNSIHYQNEFENADVMNLSFQFFQRFLSENIILENSRDLCVTRMLWMSFILEKVFKVSCNECVLHPQSILFVLNPLHVNEEEKDLLTSITIDLSKKSEWAHEHYILQKEFPNQNPLAFTWNFHAAVVVKCKVGQELQEFVFDPILSKPVTKEHWEKIFHGQFSYRSNCHMIVHESSDHRSNVVTSIPAQENHWKTLDAVQKATFIMMCMSLYSAKLATKETDQIINLGLPFEKPLTEM